MNAIKITTLVFLLSACATAPVTVPAPPQTVAKPVTETLHGVAITDPYQWLEDQESPETRAWIDAQNRYTDAILGPRPEPALFAPRLLQLLSTDQYTTPIWRRERTFFTRRVQGEELFSIAMRKHGSQHDELLVHPKSISSDLTANVGISDVALNGRMLAYYVRRGGADEVEVRFFDLDTLATIGAPLATARYSGIAISPDNHTVYFTRRTPEGPRVYRRAITGGTEEKLFGDGYGGEKIIYGTLSDDGRHLLLHVLHGSSPTKTEIYVDDLTDAAGPRTVVSDLNFRSSAELAGDTLVIQTNWNAPNQRVMTVSLADPGRANWKEIVAENPKSAIQGVSLAGGKIFVRYLEDVKPRVIGYTLEGRKVDDIAFDILGSLNDVSGSWSTPVAYFTFSSFHVPPTIYQYDVASGQRTVFARQSVPVRQEDFTVEQTWFASKDGTRVPMFVLTKKGLPRNGANPTVLTGYGGFTQSRLPGFSAAAVAWAEQGGVYAVANLRGGGEFGEEWHRAGMLERKQNTFDDFIAAGEHLIRERYTSPEHLGITGGSNGGLLVTAAATQRPELFGAVICRYPLVDMLRYHRFLVGGFWVPEYGSAERAEDFRWIHAYSPYHRVKEGTEYPAMLFVTGDADTRVAPLHARKMTALMQAKAARTEPVLLRYHVSGGHSGGEPLGVQVKNQAEELGFLWWQLQ
jgi:prolyl oligopeptidase